MISLNFVNLKFTLTDKEDISTAFFYTSYFGMKNFAQYNKLKNYVSMWLKGLNQSVNHSTLVPLRMQLVEFLHYQFASSFSFLLFVFPIIYAYEKYHHHNILR